MARPVHRVGEVVLPLSIRMPRVAVVVLLSLRIFHCAGHTKELIKRLGRYSYSSTFTHTLSLSIPSARQCSCSSRSASSTASVLCLCLCLSRSLSLSHTHTLSLSLSLSISLSLPRSCVRLLSLCIFHRAGQTKKLIKGLGLYSYPSIVTHTLSLSLDP